MDPTIMLTRLRSSAVRAQEKERKIVLFFTRTLPELLNGVFFSKNFYRKVA
jgi:hypothetical protein